MYSDSDRFEADEKPLNDLSHGRWEPEIAHRQGVDLMQAWPFFADEAKRSLHACQENYSPLTKEPDKNRRNKSLCVDLYNAEEVEQARLGQPQVC